MGIAPATSTTTATRICSSPTSSARRSCSTSTTATATSRTCARAAGLARPTPAYTGFGTDWFDYDNDGWLDLFIANGAVNIIEAQRGDAVAVPDGATSCFTTWNGRFEDVSALAGRRSSAPRSAAAPRSATSTTTATSTSSSPTTTAPCGCSSTSQAGSTHWLQVRLTSGRATGSGLAAGWVSSEPGSPTLWRRVRTDGSYLSASDVRVHFGLGAAAAVTAIVVQWPDGQRERFTDVGADRVVTLRRGTGRS